MPRQQQTENTWLGERENVWGAINRRVPIWVLTILMVVVATVLGIMYTMAADAQEQNHQQDIIQAETRNDLKHIRQTLVEIKEELKKQNGG